jgi:diguanylate cyclase (GGDEF)-like protein/PAS domain S-box-containing protein
LKKKAADKNRSKSELQRSLAESSRSRQMLLALSQAANDVQRAATPTEIFNTVGEKLSRLNLHVAIFDLLEDATQLAVRYLTIDRALVQDAEQIAGVSMEDFRYPLTEGDFYHQVVHRGEAAYHDKPVEMMAAGMPEDHRKSAHLVAAKLGLKHAIAAPLIVGGETIGLLEIVGEALTEADIPAVMTFAGQTSTALENAELQEQTQAYAAQLERRVADLNALNALASAVNESLDSDEIIQRALQEAVRMTEAYAAGLMLFDRQAGEAVLVDEWGINGELSIDVHNIPLGGGLPRQVLEREAPLVVSHRSDYEGSAHGFLEQETISSFVVIPLVGQNGVAGALYVGSSEPDHFDDQAVDLLVSIGRQLTIGIEQARLHQAVSASEERYRSLFDGVPVALFRSTPTGEIVDVNQAAVELLGFQDRETMLRSSTLSLYPDAAARSVWLSALEQHGEVHDHEMQLKRVDGEYIFVRIKSQGVRDANGQIVYIDGMVEDITKQKRLQERLRYLGYHDALTNLYNRGFFEEELKRHERGRQFPISLIIADIDDLKVINDNLGHAQGDDVLQRAAKLLSSVLRADDIVARIGGDEFAVILPRTDAEQAGIVLKRIEDRLKFANLEPEKVPLCLSFGVATAEKGASLRETLNRADDSMYRDKRIQKGDQEGDSLITGR